METITSHAKLFIHSFRLVNPIQTMTQFTKYGLAVLLVVAGSVARPQTDASSNAGGPPALPASPPAVAGSPPAAAGSGSKAPPATIVKSTISNLDDKGSYSYDIELSDGTKLIQMGNTEAPGMGENETSLVIKGSYSYVAPDGTPVNVMYIADKGGFQPTGNVIPKGTTGGASPTATGGASSTATGGASSTATGGASSTATGGASPTATGGQTSSSGASQSAVPFSPAASAPNASAPPPLSAPLTFSLA